MWCASNDSDSFANTEDSFMPNRSIISTEKAPKAIGTYSQAVKIGGAVYLSGQIPLDPKTMMLVTGDMEAQIVQVFENLKAVCEAAGGSLQQIAKLNIFLTDLSHFALVNEVMSRYFQQPYPARAAIGVASLPKEAQVEMDGILIIE
jgi:reactive intermediate/imine deaminase